MAALTGAIALPASAASLYSTGFEAPTFSLGALNGQGGWVSADTTATVENTVVYAGAQAVSARGTDFTYYPYGPITPTAPITVSMAFETTDTGLVFSNFVVGDSPGFAGITAGLALENNGEIYAVSPGFPVIGTYAPGTWIDLSMTLNYATQTYSISLDGSRVASGLAFCGGWEHSNHCDQNNITQFGVVEFDPHGLKNGEDYVDNVSVSSAPEPAAWALMLAGFAAVGAALRPRRRHSIRASRAGDVPRPASLG